MASKTSEYYSKNPEAKAKKDAYNKAYNAKPEQKKNRAKRNAARKKMIAKGKVSKGQDVDHKNGIKAGNGDKNLRAMSKSKNRGRSN
ncbi:MAG TPA: hypothetical protein VLA13_07015 [Massilibacterium sp.]|nr:hypothetical protein [Massilibacterium sp.]